MMLERLLILALAGAAGTLLRVGIAAALQRAAPGFPWGTLAVNVLGCLLFGLVWGATEQRSRFSPEVRLYALSGFMGAFTTFSTYMFEFSDLLAQQRTSAALCHLAGQNVVGLGAMVAGLALGRSL